MKTFFSTGVITITVLLFMACGGNKKEQEGHDMDNMNMSHPIASDTPNLKGIKTTFVTFTNVNADNAKSFKEIVAHYLHIKTALANDDASEAANGAKAMEQAIKKVDKSLLTDEQKKAYEIFEEGLQEDAEHIGKNSDKIEHQRGHFATLSDEVYYLVKDFGAGQLIYNNHCPMANDKQGANWLSENPVITNPYLGAKMPKCGSVEEVIK